MFPSFPDADTLQAYLEVCGLCWENSWGQGFVFLCKIYHLKVRSTARLISVTFCQNVVAKGKAMLNMFPSFSGA